MMPLSFSPFHHSLFAANSLSYWSSSSAPQRHFHRRSLTETDDERNERVWNGKEKQQFGNPSLMHHLLFLVCAIVADWNSIDFQKVIHRRSESPHQSTRCQID